MWNRNGNSHNHRKILTRITSDVVYFNSIFFHKLTLVFPLWFFFIFNGSWVSNTLAWYSLAVLYKMGFFTLCYWYFWVMATFCSLQDWLLIWLSVVYRDLQEWVLAVSCPLFKITYRFLHIVSFPCFRVNDCYSWYMLSW